MEAFMDNQFIDPAPANTPDDDARLWAALGFIFNPIIPIITLLMEDKKNQPFLRYNAVLAISWTVINILLSLILVGACIFPIGNIVMAIMVFQGKTVEIPWLSNFIKQQGWA
jgi:asparagine N-glycosylation enzyme membrane subunit Stt3